MTRHANTDHDEDFNRANWEPTQDCLGAPLHESIRAPKHGPVRDVSRGVFTEYEYAPRAAATGRRSYR